jgi:hypothetical protein
MSRQKKRPHRPKKRTPRPRIEPDTDAALIADTTRIFSCFTEIAHDFLHQSDHDLTQIACDIDYNRLAIQMWTDGPGRAAELVEILGDFLALRERHRAALAAIRPRLAALLAAPAHDHLEDLGRWHDLIRQCVIPAPVPAP